MVVFWSVLTMFPRKILAWSISNSYNRIKEEQMLWLIVEYQTFVNVKKLILGYMILKVKEYFPGMLNRGTCVYTFVKLNSVLVGWKIGKILYLMA